MVEQLVAVVRVSVFAARHKARVIANVVGEGRQQSGAKYLKCAGRGIVKPLDQNRGTDVAKDEMAVSVLPGQVRRGDLRVDHQDRSGCARAHRIHSHVDAERGRRAGHIHVEAKALDAKRSLDFHRHRRVGPLHIGSGTDQAVDVGRLFARPQQRVFCCGHADFGHH